MFLLGVAMGCFFVPTTVASIATVDRRDLAHASTLNTVVRQTGGALAPAAVTTALVLGTPRAAAANPPVAAYQHTYLTLAGIAALTAVFAFTLPDGPARAAARATASTDAAGTGAAGRPAVAGQRREPHDARDVSDVAPDA
jgi:hypothetical protein